MTGMKSTFGAAAYGGDGWSARETRHRDEIGGVWANCGIDSETAPLRSVLLHRPGRELAASVDFDAVQMLAPLDLTRAQAEHDGIADAYRQAGVTVHLVEPEGAASPNQMFVADLIFMTPEGAILARPASTVRAGEERQVARRVADLGMPILRSLRGRATFEGADALWVTPRRVLIGRGLRTNCEGAEQVAAALREMDVEATVVDMPFGTMHLMGMLRFADRDLAIAWPRRTPFAAVETLRACGYKVAFLPQEDEASQNRAFNFVTLGPRKILMVAGNPDTQAFYEALGIECVAVAAGELAKAAGAIGCLSGVLHRDRA